MSFDPHDHPGFLAALGAACLDREGRHEGAEITFRCPAPDHPDRHPSSRWHPAKAVWRCDACGAGGGALDLADRLGVQKPSRGGGGFNLPQQHCNGATPPGCTLVAYAEAKRLPLVFLRLLGLSEIRYEGAPAVRIPYRLPDGTDGPVQFRVALAAPANGGDRFRWKAGAKAILYGLDRLDHARRAGYVVIVEGASDCHTLWRHGEPALGLPGAGAWKEQRDAHHLDGIATVYVVIEPDPGGEAVKGWIAQSAIRDRVRLVDLGAHKDASGQHIADPDRFGERWAAALAAATPWTDLAEREASTESTAAWEACADLARQPRILDAVAAEVEAAGVSGERRSAQLLYLIVTSRLLGRPVSAAIKGPSSAGKSYVLDHVLALFPETAYYALSAMSDRALAYDDEPLAHRMLILYEAAGLSGDMATYLMRSLLSEGLVRYVTVEKTGEGLRPRLIERSGPTGLLVTTTATRLHPENETRMLTIPATDTREQTKQIFATLAAGECPPRDIAAWHALQTWLGHAEHRVVVPYAPALADLVPPVAVRLRRDFGLVLNLIRAHAILHQASRDRGDAGRIVATVDDYAVVRDLVADLVAEGVEATVPATVRETVLAVQAVTGSDDDATVSVATLAKALKLDKSACSRRVRAATDAGYLKNLEDRKGRPARLAVADPMPDDLPILPPAEQVIHHCSGAGDFAGVQPPPPPSASGGVADAGTHGSPSAAEATESDGAGQRCVECGGPAVPGALCCSRHGGGPADSTAAGCRCRMCEAPLLPSLRDICATCERQLVEVA